MDFHKHELQLPVMNFDTVARNEQNYKRHGHLLPNSIRALFTGASGCGKTNALLALLIHDF